MQGQRRGNDQSSVSTPARRHLEVPRPSLPTHEGCINVLPEGGQLRSRGCDI
ncbi:hypothetical protein BDP81DRAFT_415355 [Colletotrichum phormii]|uniref:Uncharacterized protein n=1 Tax=Colletotrichum phormii TaxID=359342 RepID=A0AAJ0A3D3_9PEZI|nr:uncharacterized protein BDP81DRAFT_415355 [Colletotrichum phormii]KAK1654277.1 hypothetical protein BDP81DRAFT_415355 [Colletotrichum phormii]